MARLAGGEDAAGVDLVHAVQHAGGDGGAGAVILADDGVPGVPAHDAVGGEALEGLEGPDGGLGGGAVDAVVVRGGEAGVEVGQDGEVVLNFLHLVAAVAGAQGFGEYAGDLVFRQALGFQLRQTFHGVEDGFDLVPGGLAHDAVGGQVENALERFDGLRHRRVVVAAEGQDGPEAGVVLADAVELALQDPHILAGAAQLQCHAGVGHQGQR